VRGVFVTGTGTEVGKTVVAAVIAHGLARSGERVAVFKPAVTGLENGGDPDHERLRRAAGSDQADDEVAPYRFAPAVSPHLAAELAGTTIDPALLVRRGPGGGPGAGGGAGGGGGGGGGGG
jgi:dethiobiotin synthetase